MDYSTSKNKTNLSNDSQHINILSIIPTELLIIFLNKLKTQDTIQIKRNKLFDKNLCNLKLINKELNNLYKNIIDGWVNNAKYMKIFIKRFNSYSREFYRYNYNAIFLSCRFKIMKNLYRYIKKHQQQLKLSPRIINRAIIMADIFELGDYEKVKKKNLSQQIKEICFQSVC